MSILQKIFSPKGELNRKEYLIYGFIVPLIIFILGVIIDSEIANEISKTIGLVCFLIALYVGFIATLKRARATASSTFLTMFLWLIFTPIVILYLLFAPAKAVDSSGEQKKQLGIIGVVAIIFVGIVVLGIVSAVVIPKLAKSHDSQKVEQQIQSTPIIDSQKKVDKFTSIV